MLEGEGPMVMEDYFDRGLRDLCARVADREGIPMRRGMRARSSTDSVIPSRMGIPTACFASLNRHKGLSNYHLPSDTPDRLHYKTVALRSRPRRGGRPRARRPGRGARLKRQRGRGRPGPRGAHRAPRAAIPRSWIASPVESKSVISSARRAPARDRRARRRSRSRRSRATTRRRPRPTARRPSTPAPTRRRTGGSARARRARPRPCRGRRRRAPPGAGPGAGRRRRPPARRPGSR